MKVKKLEKIFINNILITISILSITSSFLPDVNQHQILQGTWVFTICIYIYVINSLIKLKIPNAEQNLLWAGMAIYVSSFWLAWQIMQESGNFAMYIKKFFASIVLGFAGVTICFFLSHVSDRLKKTW